MGGLDDSTCFNIVERYDVESDTWSFVQAMIMPRGGVAVATLKVLSADTGLEFTDFPLFRDK